MKSAVLLAFFEILIAMVSANVLLKERYNWNFIDFDFKSEEVRQTMTESGDYMPSANVLIDSRIAPDGRIFCTVVRDKGVPASLTTISRKKRNGQTLLTPYPSWEWTNVNSCISIISVYRTYILKNHLYVIDCGKIGDDKVCPPKLLVFNLQNDKLVNKIIISDNVAMNKDGKGLLINVLPYLDKVFLTDTEGRSLIELYEKLQFRIESSAFLPDPAAAYQTINGTSYYLEDGPFGLAAVPSSGGYRHYVYISVLASKQLRKMTLEATRYPNHWRNIEILNCEMSQIGPLATVKSTLYMSYVTENKVVYWDTRKPCHSRNIHTFVKDDDKLQFVSGLQAVQDDPYCVHLLITSNRYQNVATNKLNINETNFRILDAVTCDHS
ncbi:hypothetical protein KM043_005542 [Ampulex compressa]|nr:hypothetical protein KM043_005542 [Ampulex compressa]